uniref:5'-3' exoribonuclease n=1 Tax=Chrysotila carterae TaxID=13221 RepID=A0A7S4B4U0_CHRCT
MGVPAFFRWLADKYPKIVVDACETIREPGDPDADLTLPNPNGIEYDALYLDMNGIIHPCARPEGRPPPATEEEMFGLICQYIDRIFSVIRPRKLLFLAIDGPAPRAKMNQQRARRFKAAKEREEKKAETAKLRAEMFAMGRELPPEDEGNGFDSNVITPGTAFMARLASWLRHYAQHRLHTHEAWRGIQVIFSDASVPGEGEHKIMEHIRRQRRMPGYEPNTRHCIHGLDADLIMLALATHEPHFSILREVVLDRKQQEKQKEAIEAGHVPGPPKLQLLQVWVLREYLHKEFSTADYSAIAGGYDLERVIDDFVFMCFFVGNDFLPHIPALEIKDGAIDMLIYAYKQLAAKLGGYLTDAGRVHLPRTEALLREVAVYEDEIFERRRKREEGYQRSAHARAFASGGEVPDGAFGSLYPPRDATQQQLHDQIKGFGAQEFGSEPETLELSGSLSGFHRASAHLYATLFNCTGHTAPNQPFVVRRKKPDKASLKQVSEREASAAAAAAETAGVSGDEHLDFDTRLTLRLQRKEAELQAQPDEVRFGEKDWKERYYAVKLGMPKAEEAARREVAKHYVQGLCWVLMYYYQGVQDWGWFYPFHYAPCASDLVQLEAFSGGRFSLGAPFSPFEQLMAVFPPASGHALPPSYRDLMVSPHSPIIDFFPIDFRNDLNGKKFSWQAVALLPFIDAPRLRQVLRPLRSNLSAEEQSRDRFGDTLLFTSRNSQIGAACAEFVCTPSAQRAPTLPLAPACGLSGALRPSAQLRMPDSALHAPHGVGGYGLPPSLDVCTSVAAAFDEPPHAPHAPKLLRGVVLPEPALDKHDQPHFSRDSDHATRLMAARLNGQANGQANGNGYGYGNSNGYAKGGRYGGGGAHTPAGRMIHGALGTPRGQQRVGRDNQHQQRAQDGPRVFGHHTR